MFFASRGQRGDDGVVVVDAVDADDDADDVCFAPEVALEELSNSVLDRKGPCQAENGDVAVVVVAVRGEKVRSRIAGRDQRMARDGVRAQKVNKRGGVGAVVGDAVAGGGAGGAAAAAAIAVAVVAVAIAAVSAAAANAAAVAVVVAAARSEVVVAAGCCCCCCCGSGGVNSVRGTLTAELVWGPEH